MLGVVVLVVAIIAIVEPTGHTRSNAGGPTSGSSVASTSATPTSSSASSPSSSASGPSLSLGRSPGAGAGRKLPLVVLNNTTTNGLASQAADTFTAGGWTVSSVGNLTNDILSTCAYYDPDVPGAEAAATRLQQQFDFIQRTAEKFPELPAGPIVVVLTPDYSPQ